MAEVKPGATATPSAPVVPAPAPAPVAASAAAPAAAPAAPAAPAPAEAKPAAAAVVGEPKPAEPQGPAGAPAAEPPKAPDTYTLVIPDAGKAHVDETLLQEIETMARASSWSNVDAQNAVDEVVIRSEALSTRFLAETTKDTEFGGEHLPESQRLAQTAIDRVFPVGHRLREAFMRDMRSAGTGNKLTVVGFLATLGKLMGEDSPAFGRSGGGGPPADAASKLYDHPSSRALEPK